MKKVNEKIMNKLDHQLKYAKERFGINSLEELKEEMKNVELDIGAFTMPFIIKKSDK